jgi:hypothetical protein
VAERPLVVDREPRRAAEELEGLGIERGHVTPIAPRRPRVLRRPVRPGTNAP